MKRCRVFALTTRGLERVSAEEMAAIAGVRVDNVGYRRVTAECLGSLEPMLGMRTVDDVFLALGTWTGIGHRREALSAIGSLAARLDLMTASDTIGEIRPIGDPPTFSVTANFVGRRNYSVSEIKDAVAAAVETQTGWTCESDDRQADLNLRVFIEHEQAFVGARLGARPLHRRAYKRRHVPGSLKPPVAAALLSLGAVGAGMRLLDPFCGAGTILIEAGLAGAQAVGGDISPGAIEASRENASSAGIAGDLGLWDGLTLPLADGAVDCLVTNLPWGGEVQVGRPLRAFYERACVEVERVVRTGGRIVLLTDVAGLVRLSQFDLERRVEISLSGRTPTILVFA